MSAVGEPEVVWAYRTYFPALRRKCRRMLADEEEARDIAQEAFTRLWRSRLDLRDTDHVVGWLYLTATRLAVDHLRAARAQGHEREDAHTLVAPGDGPEDVVAARAALHRIAAVLSAHELELLVLWRLDGLLQHEIAKVLSLGERTVRRRLQRVQQRLSRLGGLDA